MFIDARLLTLTAPWERNVYRAFVSLLLYGANEFGCGSAALRYPPLSAG